MLSVGVKLCQKSNTQERWIMWIATIENTYEDCNGDITSDVSVDVCSKSKEKLIKYYYDQGYSLSVNNSDIAILQKGSLTVDIIKYVEI